MQKKQILRLHYWLDAVALQLGWHFSLQEEESYCHTAVSVH